MCTYIRCAVARSAKRAAASVGRRNLGFFIRKNEYKVFFFFFFFCYATLPSCLASCAHLPVTAPTFALPAAHAGRAWGEPCIAFPVAEAGVLLAKGLC